VAPETLACSWDRPVELGGKPKQSSEVELLKQEFVLGDKDRGKYDEWVQMYDPNHRTNYYYNNFTGESMWEKPAGMPLFCSLSCCVLSALSCWFVVQDMWIQWGRALDLPLPSGTPLSVRV
jgi:hypothetical protein